MHIGGGVPTWASCLLVSLPLEFAYQGTFIQMIRNRIVTTDLLLMIARVNSYSHIYVLSVKQSVFHLSIHLPSSIYLSVSLSYSSEFRKAASEFRAGWRREVDTMPHREEAFREKKASTSSSLCKSTPVSEKARRVMFIHQTLWSLSFFVPGDFERNSYLLILRGVSRWACCTYTRRSRIVDMPK